MFRLAPVIAATITSFILWPLQHLPGLLPLLLNNVQLLAALVFLRSLKHDSWRCLHSFLCSHLLLVLFFLLLLLLLLLVPLFLLGLAGLGLRECRELLMDSFELQDTNTHTVVVLGDGKTAAWTFVSPCFSIHPRSVKLFCVAHPPVVSHKPPSPFIFHPLTCSCNSANRCCLSCSESPAEDSDSEVLELSSSETAERGGACRLEGAGWRADDGVGTGTGSSGSSGILAKRISNTSCRDRGCQETEPQTTKAQTAPKSNNKHDIQNFCLHTY